MSKNGGKGVWVRDLAQEQTLSQWKKGDVIVRVRTLGAVFVGRLIHVGPYAIKLRLEGNHEDVCLFKTCIIAVVGPRVVELQMPFTEMPKAVEAADHCSDVEPVAVAS